MEGFFGIFLFLIFILAPLLEQMRKQQGKQPPPRRPPMRLPEQPRSDTEEVSGKSRESASEMVPDDLWQILTGEQRPPVSTPPEPVAESRRKQPWDVVYIPPEAAEDEEAEAGEDVNVEVARTAGAEVRRETERRPGRGRAVSLEEAPVIVSLETPLPSSAVRHAAFHEKLARLTEAPPTPQRRRRSLLGNTTAELQRAFILQEVLGRPRGLE